MVFQTLTIVKMTTLGVHYDKTILTLVSFKF